MLRTHKGNEGGKQVDKSKAISLISVTESSGLDYNFNKREVGEA